MPDPITKSPTPQIKTPKATPLKKPRPMNFGEALSETARGEKITKLEWGDKNIYGHLVNAELRLNKNGKDYQWVISEGDIIGTDYIIV